MSRCTTQAGPAEQKSYAMTRWAPAVSPRTYWTPRGQTLRKDSREPGPGTIRTSRTQAPGRGWAPKMRAQLGWLVGRRSPARGANHLCHTVTIILHKIIIKNPNFSASNPASGLLAFSSAGVCGPVITGSLPPCGACLPRARNQALIKPARGPGWGRGRGGGPGGLQGALTDVAESSRVWVPVRAGSGGGRGRGRWSGGGACGGGLGGGAWSGDAGLVRGLSGVGPLRASGGRVRGRGSRVGWVAGATRLLTPARRPCGRGAGAPGRRR